MAEPDRGRGDRLARAIASASHAVARAFEEVPPGVRVTREGRVVSAADGVLRIAGLEDVGAEDLLELDGSQRALVLGLRPGQIEAIALDEASEVAEGARVRGLGRRASIRVGVGCLGRVVDPMGRALDGEPLTGRFDAVPIERDAPAIYERAAVRRPLYTGTLAIDAMLPIGRGQRELIAGDEGTGKTALAVEAMLRQRDTDVLCVYVAIGRRRAETWQIVDALRRGGGRWAVVAAFQDASPGLRYLAPYAGTALAEWFVERGEHALVVYDDLTAHAATWRELSLLLRRPPGREAYPGDVFYVHSRLLERATQLAPERGGGSLTALPIAVTEDGRLSAYIPTNLVSITDGQIVLSRGLFSAGQKPAIDVGQSVSRVGGKAQAQALRELAGRLRLDYAAFLELEVFARLGTRLEESARRRLEHGRRVRRLLRARRFEPLGVFEETARLVLVNAPEILARVPVERVEEIVPQLVEAMRRDHPGVARRLDSDAVLGAEDQRALERSAERALRA